MEGGNDAKRGPQALETAVGGSRDGADVVTGTMQKNSLMSGDVQQQQQQQQQQEVSAPMFVGLPQGVHPLGIDPSAFYYFPHQNGVGNTSGSRAGREPLKYMNRRSLKMLTSQFLGEYGRQDGCIIHVEAASEKLNTAKRRVYDIMAVCAEIGLVSRAGKGQYMWHGEKKVMQAVAALSSREAAETKHAASLAGLTRGMVGFLARTGPDQLVEVDSIAIKVLGLDGTLDSKVLKSKLRRAYDVSSVLCALKMARDDLVKDGEVTKHKRCLMWKGTEEIGHAIEEAEKIDFSASYTLTTRDDVSMDAGNVQGMVYQGFDMSRGYALPGMFPSHPGMITGNGMDKDSVISPPQMIPDIFPLQNNNNNNYPGFVVPVGAPPDAMVDMNQHNLAMMHYFAMQRHGMPQGHENV